MGFAWWEGEGGCACWVGSIWGKVGGRNVDDG